VSILPSRIAMAGAGAPRAEGGQVDALGCAGATSPERARPLEAMGVVRDAAVERLGARGVLRAQGAGFYLDEATLAAQHDRRAWRTLLAAALVVCASLVALAAGTRRR
jgi:hypothetical protein